MRSYLRIAGIIVVGGTTLAAISAEAGPWGKPGLWETTANMHMAMGGMPAMTAAQTAQMKKMGVKMPTMDGQSITTKMCVTPAEAAQFSAHRYSSRDAGCKQESVKQTGNHIVATLVCDGRMKGSGTADVTLIDDAHYSSVFAFKGVSHGHPMDMKVSTTARWLGVDCGSVKPFTPPKHA